MSWEIPRCNGGDCCVFYGRSDSPYRIVTNGREFKIQERKSTFWRGKEYWADVEDNCGPGGGMPPTYYPTLILEARTQEGGLYRK